MGDLRAENVVLKKIADQFGTPCYVYFKQKLLANWHAFNSAFHNYPHRICYAVKANSNIGILNLLAQQQSGFDVVSQGELERVIVAQGQTNKIVFSGVGKNAHEIARALDVNIFCFDVESEDELHHIQKIAAEKNKIAAIAFRANPNIDAGTHPYIATGLHENKFGIDIQQIPGLCEKTKSLPNIELIGLACHIGSQITTLEPFLEAADSMLTLIQKLKTQGFILKHLNLGGGLGICYRNENVIPVEEYVNAILEKVRGHALEIIIEPGRSIIGNAGVLLTRVEYLKKTAHKNFAIVDASMTELIRPALYDAFHEIASISENKNSEKIFYDIVGPVCETGDFLGKHRELALQKGDILAILNAGAYGFSMCSNYNSRPRAAEVLVDGDKIHLLRERENVGDLFARERIVS